ncbi:MAG: aminotransferase class V-fold PLP-dependent enzyme [Acidilobus sp.]
MIESEFPSLRGRSYLDWAAVGVPPLRSIGAIRSLLDAYEASPELVASMSSQDEAKSAARLQLGPLLGCSPGHLVFTGTSTTSAVQAAVDSIPMSKGENVVVLDIDFPLAHAEAYRLRAKGVEVRVVRNRDGDYDIDQFYEVIDRRTRAVIVSSVIWVNGLRLDVEELAKVVHEAESYLLVDAIQQAGALRPRGLEKADFVAFGTQKWLLAPFGLGGMCVSDRAVEELKPPRPGYSGAPVKDWDSYWLDPAKGPFYVEPYRNDAPLKFEYGGSMSPIPLRAAAASASLINEVGIENVETKIMRLRKALIEELEDMNVDLISPPESSKASGIILFRVGEKPRDCMDAARRLRARNVIVSARGAAGVWGIRASVHFPNEEENVIALTEAIKEVTS